MNFVNTYFCKYKKYLLISIIVLVLLLFGGIYLVHASSMSENEIDDEVIIKEEVEVPILNADDIQEKVLVDIKGAVVSPGVYQLDVGCSVQDAINMAGGLLENANTKVINLSKRVFDEMVIIVYTNEDIEKYQKEPDVITEFVYIELPCECPDTMNDACIDTGKETNGSSQSGLISINKATKEQLMTLTGIGASKAEAIIKYREEKGEFSDIKDIMNVSGIGESAFEKIKDNITI